MKLFRVIFLIPLFVVANSIFYSCCLGTSCGCGTTEAYNYKVIDYEILLREYSKGNGTSYINSGSILIENSEALFNGMVIVLHAKTSSVSYIEMPNLSFPGTAYACSPAENPTQTFSDLSIVSSTEYQTSAHVFAAGENLASIFDIYEYGSQKSVTDFLQGMNYAYNSHLYFLLTAPPVSESSHKFSITVKFSDGSVIDITTSTIKIKA
jgi:hypothetical protein